jgi:FixJ family two-component response regulator
MRNTPIKKANPTVSDPAVQKVMPTKHQQIIDLLSRDAGATLEDMSNTANWLTHSTRAFLSSLKKRGYDVVSDKVEGVRRYKIAKEPVA